jgi:hypothetical protein
MRQLLVFLLLMIGLSIKLEIEVESENCFCSISRILNGSAGINCCPKILPISKINKFADCEILLMLKRDARLAYSPLLDSFK